MWFHLMKSTWANWKSSITAMRVFDRRPDQRGATSYTTELGTGLTSWWHSEIELGLRSRAGRRPADAADPGGVGKHDANHRTRRAIRRSRDFTSSMANRRRPAATPASNEITFGPVIAKDIGRTTHTINLFFTRQLGPDQTTPGPRFQLRMAKPLEYLGAIVAGGRDLWRHRHAGKRTAAVAAAIAARSGRGWA